MADEPRLSFIHFSQHTSLQLHPSLFVHFKKIHGVMNLLFSIPAFLTGAGGRTKPIIKQLPALDKKEFAKVIPLHGQVKLPATAKVIFMDNRKEKIVHF